MEMTGGKNHLTDFSFFFFFSGFSGKIPDTMTESVTTWSEKYNANVEEDQVVTAYDNGSS